MLRETVKNLPPSSAENPPFGEIVVPFDCYFRGHN